MYIVTLHITQHKKFVSYGTHPNFCFAKTSFILGTLDDSRLYESLGDLFEQ